MEDFKRCPHCAHKAAEPHPCPLREVLSSNTSNFLCECCEECTEACSDDCEEDI